MEKYAAPKDEIEKARKKHETIPLPSPKPLKPLKDLKPSLPAATK